MAAAAAGGVVVAAGWIFVINSGESFVGTEPAQTRWRKALMSSGVGLRGCCSSSLMVGGGGGTRSGNVEMGGAVVVISVLGAADGVEFSAPSRVGVIAAERFLACGSGGLVVTGRSESVGLSAFGDALVWVIMADALTPVELVFALHLTMLSSSSDEMSTTIWADIIP